MKPAWGVSVTFSSTARGWPAPIGSSAKTSRPAARSFPPRSASTRAASSITAPRAVLTRIAPGRIRARRRASIMPAVSSLRPRWSETTWESASSASRVAIGAHGRPAGTPLRFQAITSMPRPAPRRTISRPTPPVPTTPRVLPASSTPSSVCQLPARSARSIRAVWRTAVEHQRERVLGDRAVAIALDGAHLDAAPRRRRHVDIARRAGPHEDDHLQRPAGAEHVVRHVGVVVDDAGRIADMGCHVAARHVVDGHGEVGDDGLELVVVERGQEGRTVEEDRTHLWPPGWLWTADCSRRGLRAGVSRAAQGLPPAVDGVATARRRCPVLTRKRPTTMQASAAQTQKPRISSKSSSAQKSPKATTR